MSQDLQLVLSLLFLLILGGFFFGISAVLARQLRLNAISWGLLGVMTAGISTVALALWWLFVGRKQASAKEDSKGLVKYNRSVARERTFWGYSPGLQERLGLMIVDADLLIILGPETLEKYRWPLIVGFFLCTPLFLLGFWLWMLKRASLGVLDSWYAFLHGDAVKVRSHPAFHVVVPAATARCAFDGQEIRVDFPSSLLPEQLGWLPTEADQVKILIKPWTLSASQARKFVHLCGGTMSNRN